MDALDLALRVQRKPDGLVKVTLEVPELDLTVTSETNDLRRSVINAAGICATELRKRGYDCTREDVLIALSDATERAMLRPTSTSVH